MATSFRGPASSSTATGGLRPGLAGCGGMGGGHGCQGLGVPGLGMWGHWLGGCLAWPFQALCISVPSTILVEPGCQAEVTETGDIRVSVGAEAPSTVGAQLDPIHLSIFSHRFMSIAGEWRHCPPGPPPCGVRCGVCLLGRVGAGGTAGGAVQGARVTQGKGQKRSLGWWQGRQCGLALACAAPAPGRVPSCGQPGPWDCLWTGRGLSAVNLCRDGGPGSCHAQRGTGLMWGPRFLWGLQALG